MSYRGGQSYRVLAAFGLLNFLLMAFTFNSLGQVLPFMVPDLAMSWAEAGFGFTLLGVACGAASVLPAMMVRVAGVSRTLLAGTAMLIAGFGALALAHSVAAYYLGTVLLGVGYCFCGAVPAVHVISAIFERRSTALGAYFAAGNFGSVGGPIMFYAVTELIGGWRTFWLLCGATTLIAGVIAAITMSARAPIAADATDSLPLAEIPGWTARRALATPQYWIIVCAYVACLLANTTLHGFAFQHLLENGQTKASATAIISFAALVLAAAAGLAGLAGERIEPRWLTLVSLAALAIAALSLAMPREPGAMWVFGIGMGIGLGFSYVGTAMLLQDYFGRRANLELFSIMTAISTVAAIGPGLGGVVRDQTGSFVDVFAALAAIDAIFVVVVFFMRRPVETVDIIGVPGLTRSQPSIG